MDGEKSVVEKYVQVMPRMALICAEQGSGLLSTGPAAGTRPWCAGGSGGVAGAPGAVGELPARPGKMRHRLAPTVAVCWPPVATRSGLRMLPSRWLAARGHFGHQRCGHGARRDAGQTLAGRARTPFDSARRRERDVPVHEEAAAVPD